MEDVSQVPIATAAAHFSAGATVALVYVGLDRAVFDLVVKAGPSAAAVKLVVGRVELLGTACTVVKALLFVVQVAASSWSLRGRMSKKKSGRPTRPTRPAWRVGFPLFKKHPCLARAPLVSQLVEFGFE